MPKKIEDTTPETTTSVEEKLDMMVMYLQRMDRRDRIRTIGGFIHGMIAIIPIALLLWSTWYFIVHGKEFMEMVTKEAVKQSASYTQDSMMDQLQQYMGNGQ